MSPLAAVNITNETRHMKIHNPVPTRSPLRNTAVTLILGSIGLIAPSIALSSDYYYGQCETSTTSRQCTGSIHNWSNHDARRHWIAYVVTRPGVTGHVRANAALQKCTSASGGCVSVQNVVLDSISNWRSLMGLPVNDFAIHYRVKVNLSSENNPARAKAGGYMQWMGS